MSTMPTRVLQAWLLVVLAGTAAVQLAHADIYTWVDGSGTINVSNLPPPEGVSVTKVTHESPSAPRDEVARAAAHQAEVQALEDRVGQLENEVQFARLQAAPPADYRAIPAPPVIQYIVEPAPPVMQYAPNPAPPQYAGCDPTWTDCGSWWVPGFYAASVVFLRPANFRHFRPGSGGHHFMAQQPGRAAQVLRRG
jgi:hypothetical protein